jgi:hypothetical protein
MLVMCGMVRLLLLEGVLHLLLPSLLIRQIHFHAHILVSMSMIKALEVVKVILVVQNHGIHEIHRVVEHVALNHLALLAFFILGVLVMIRLIHCLIMVLLRPTSFIYDNRLFFPWGLNIPLVLLSRCLIRLLLLHSIPALHFALLFLQFLLALLSIRLTRLRILSDFLGRRIRLPQVCFLACKRLKPLRSVVCGSATICL